MNKKTETDHQIFFEIPSRGIRKENALIVATYCLSFGEPDGKVDIGPQVLPEPSFHLSLSPEEAIAIGEAIISIAKLSRARRKRWERKRIQGHMFLDRGDLDDEDICAHGVT